MVWRLFNKARRIGPGLSGRPVPSRLSFRAGGSLPDEAGGPRVSRPGNFYIPQRGVQWKQGVAIYMMLYTSLLYNTTPIHCTPLPLHPPVMNTQSCPTAQTPTAAFCAKIWAFRDVVFQDVVFQDTSLTPLTHIIFRCEVPTPPVFEGQSTIMIKPHILKHHIPELAPAAPIRLGEGAPPIITYYLTL